MKRVLYTVIAWLLVAQAAHAQGHPCDLPTPAPLTSVTAGQTFTLGACTPDPASGANALTSVRVYRNGALVSAAVVTIGATANAEGLRFVSHARAEATPGTYTYEFEPVNAQGPGPKLSFVAVSVTPAPTLPSALTRPRIQ